MENITVFGSDKCPNCPPAIEMLEKYKIEFKYINITDSMKNLKEFLKLRDNRKEFEIIKKEGYVGIPCFLVDEKIYFDVNKLLK